jgi:hypothetical protein
MILSEPSLTVMQLAALSFFLMAVGAISSSR